MGNEACRVSHLTVDPRVGIFLEPLNTNDGFFFSYTSSTFRDRTVQYSIIYVGDVTDVDVYSQWHVLYKSTWNNEQMVISSEWIYKN